MILPSEVVRIESSGVGLDRADRTRKHALRALGLFTVSTILGAALMASVGGSRFCGLACFPAFGVLVSLFWLVMAITEGPPVLTPGVVTIADGFLSMVPDAKDEAWMSRRIPLADVVQGHWEEPDRCCLALRGGEVVVARATPEEGERLLRAAGVTAAERVLRVPLPSAASRVWGGRLFCTLAAGFGALAVTTGVLMCVVACLDVLHGAAGIDALAVPAVLLVSLAVEYLFVGLLRRREVTVGTDGVVLRTLFGLRSVPYADVQAVHRDTAGLRIEVRDGHPLILRTRRSGDPPLPQLDHLLPHRPGREISEAEVRRNVLFDRIQEAMAARPEDAPPEASLALLDRGGRPIAAWREELSKLLGITGGYRATTLSAADLGHVVADPSAPAARRIAAAVALSSSAPDDARRRARIAAQACADARLARALERAGEGEIEAAVVVEEELAAQERAARGPSG